MNDAEPERPVNQLKVPLVGVSSARTGPGLADDSIGQRMGALKSWSLTATGITTWVVFVLLLGLIAVGLPSIMRGVAPKQISLKLLSLPSGAKIFMDGVDTKRKTDALFEDLSPSVRYKFRLEVPGFDPLVRHFTFGETEIPEDGSPLVRQLILTKAKGTIRVSSEPTGCEVYANGRYMGQTPLMAKDLSRERDDLVLLLRQAGYQDHRQVMRWASEVALNVSVVMEKEPKVENTNSRRKRGQRR